MNEIISVRMQRKITDDTGVERLASFEFAVERSLLEDVPDAGRVIIDMLDRGFAAELSAASEE
jgi:hypothetical protein